MFTCDPKTFRTKFNKKVSEAQSCVDHVSMEITLLKIHVSFIDAESY